MKKNIIIVVCMISFMLPIIKAIGECYTGFANDGLSCSIEGRFRSASIHECCVHANATGFSDTSSWVIFPEIFNRNKRVSCKACADTFNETNKWCFSYRNRADATCIHIPKGSTLPAQNERDCCLWLNASGYTEEPFWQWSTSYGRWYTSCGTCFKDRFVACYSKFGENEAGDTFCEDPQPRLAVSPYECCRRPNVTGFAWMETSRHRKCHPCPVDGGWSSWTAWSPCSATCGDSFRRRVRTCNNPHPRHGGSDCLGKSEETEPCNVLLTCPGDPEGTATQRSVIHHNPQGYWSQWTAVSHCSVTCGKGVFERRRTCLTRSNSRLICEGDDTDMHPCQNQDCLSPPPVTTENAEANLNWTWTSWSPCHSTCGFGIRSRSRVCIQTAVEPRPDPGSTNQTVNCPVDGTEVEVCEQQPCPPVPAEKYSLGVTIAWSIAGVASAALIAGMVFLICKKRRWYQNYVPQFTGKRSSWASKGRRERGQLPPVPACDPTQYCSVSDLNARYVTKPSAPDVRLQDDDGYEIPRQYEDSDRSDSTNADSKAGNGAGKTDGGGKCWGSNMAINHVYEQIDFDIDNVTQTDAMPANESGAKGRFRKV